MKVTDQDWDIRPGSYIYDTRRCEGIADKNVCPLAMLAFAIKTFGSLRAAVEHLDAETLAQLGVIRETGQNDSLPRQLSYFDQSPPPTSVMQELPDPHAIVCLRHSDGEKRCGIVFVQPKRS